MFEKLKLIKKNQIFLIILFINIIFLLSTLSNTYTDGYNLRQAQTAIMARNIFYDNLNIFPTRLTFFAPLKGNIIFEFPFVHFITALSYKIFSISEINGRVINLILYIFNGIIFYKIQNFFFDKKIATSISILFISSPLILYLAHAYMPETSMMSFYLSSYYFYIKSKIQNNKFNKALLVISLIIGPLIKPPAGIIYIPIFLDSINNSNFKKLIKNFIFLLGCSLPFLCWMIYATIINSSDLSTGSNYGDWSNILFGKSSIMRLWFDLNFYKKILSYFLIQHLNPLTFLIAISSLLNNFQTKNSFNKFHINWILGNLSFLFIFAGANYGHPYYQIYFTPPLLYFVGIFFSNNNNKFSRKNLILNLCLIINLFFSIAIFLYGSNEKLRISNINEFNSVVSEKIKVDKNLPSEYILISHEGLASTAVYTYYADAYSKQYFINGESVKNIINETNSGAKYVFFLNTKYGDTIDKLKNNKELYTWLNQNKIKVYESKTMILYKLN